jgi:hypothetical protein
MTGTTTVTRLGATTAANARSACPTAIAFCHTSGRDSPWCLRKHRLLVLSAHSARSGVDSQYSQSSFRFRRGFARLPHGLVLAWVGCLPKHVSTPFLGPLIIVSYHRTSTLEARRAQSPPPRQEVPHGTRRSRRGEMESLQPRNCRLSEARLVRHVPLVSTEGPMR